MDKSLRQKLDDAANAWEVAVNRREPKVALKAGIDAYLLGEAEGDELESKAALGLIHVAITMILEQGRPPPTSQPSCSFCGSSGPDIKLGAGPTAYICAGCVGIFYEEAGLRPDK